MVTIRRAVPEDMEQIRGIIKGSFHGDYAAAGEFYSVQRMADPNYAAQTGPYCSREAFISSIIDGLEERLSKPFDFFVACEGKEIEGFIIMEDNNGSHWVNNIFVRQDRQGRGIAKRLFEFAAGGRKELYLWVNSDNPAVKFWEKLGFRTVLQERLMSMENAANTQEL